MPLKRINIAIRTGALLLSMAALLSLAGCGGLMIAGAVGSIGAAGGLAATEKDRQAKEQDPNYVPPAQRVPAQAQQPAQSGDETPSAAPQAPITVQPAPSR